MSNCLFHLVKRLRKFASGTDSLVIHLKEQYPDVADERLMLGPESFVLAPNPDVRHENVYELFSRK